MKKAIQLFLVLIISGSFALAQNNDMETSSILKKIQKSEKHIKHDKKKLKPQTWFKRAEIFVDAYEVNIKYLGAGIPKSQMSFIGISETSSTQYYGKPNDKKVEGNKEIWVYDKVEITFEDGVISSFKDLKPIDKEAHTKAYKAIKEAVKLDTDGKFANKSGNKKTVARVRDIFQTKAIDAYFAENLETALANIEIALELYQLPRDEKTDTFYNYGMSNYYAGIFAYNTKNYDKGCKYFKTAGEEGYEVGTCYQYRSTIKFEQKDSTAGLKILQEGIAKYPDEKGIIFALIDYYMPRGEYEKAFEYTDKAISMDPDNHILYLVKAEAYSNIYEKLDAKYYENIAKSDQLKKDAFKVRGTDKEKEILAEKAKVDAQTPKLLADAEEYFKKSEDTYNLGISKKPEEAVGYYSLGALYYNKAMEINKHAQDIPASQKERYEKEMKKYEDNLKLAMPQMEKAHEKDPNDTYALQSLSSIYLKLGMYDKQKEVKAKLEALIK